MSREAEVAATLSGGRWGWRVGIVPDEESAALPLHRFDVDAHQAARGLPRSAVAGTMAEATTQCGCGNVEQARGGMRMPEKRSQGGNVVVQPQRHRISSFDRFSNDRKDRVPIALRVFEALENEHDRGVTRDVPVLGEKCFGRTPMHRLAREVRGSHHGRVELAVTEGTNGKLERPHPGQLFGGKRKGRAADIELAVETVGRNVRHGPEHALGTKERHDAFSGGLHPGIVESKRGGPFGEAPAGSVTCDLGIALRTDEDAGRLGGKVETLGGFPGGCEDHRLLTKRLLQILWRKTQPRQIELHGFGGRALPCTD